MAKKQRDGTICSGMNEEVEGDSTRQLVLQPGPATALEGFRNFHSIRNRYHMHYTFTILQILRS